MRATGRRRAFVLITALLVLTLAGVMMSAAVRQSSSAALEASAKLEGLRRRWGALSLQRALLGQVEQRLVAAEADAGPVVLSRDRIALAGVEFELIFSDEQAKANVNAVLARRGLTATVVAVGDLLTATGSGVAIDVSVLGGAERFGSYGQIFSPPYVDQLLAADGEDPPPAALLTCWGDGKINFRRCRPAALKVATDGVLTLGQQARLLALRADVPGLSLGEVLAQLDLAERKRSAATGLLTDRSRCHSLWIVARATGPSRRRWHRLAIISEADEPPVRVFVW